MKVFLIDLFAITLFALALIISVMVHEFGHFITARIFNMKVTEFFVGFGKRIWSFERGETEYGIKVIPAGGYCRIAGMVPTEEMPAGEEGRAFYKASAWKRVVVLISGSLGHMLIGIILLFALFVTSCVGCNDGRIAEERAGHQCSFGEDEEEPGGDSEGPAAPIG